MAQSRDVDDAIAAQHDTVYDVPFPRDLVLDVVQSIKKNLKVDWTLTAQA